MEIVKKVTCVEMTPDRILVNQALSDGITKGGIVLPDQSSGKKLSSGKIVNMGKRRPDNFDYPEMKIGDEVYFTPMGGVEVKVDDVDLLVISLPDVFWVVRK